MTDTSNVEDTKLIEAVKRLRDRSYKRSIIGGIYG